MAKGAVKAARRKGAAAESVDGVEAQLQQKLHTAAVLQRMSATAEAGYKKVRPELAALMGMLSLSEAKTLDGVIATYDYGDEEYVDVVRLRALVPDDVFMSLIKVTVGEAKVALDLAVQNETIKKRRSAERKLQIKAPKGWAPPELALVQQRTSAA